jgi:hypothetical protein
MVRQYIIMEIFMKDNLLKAKDVDMVHIILIKYINMSVNGNIIVFMVKVDFQKMVQYFLKECLKKD